jgi:hypothetical protein
MKRIEPLSAGKASLLVIGLTFPAPMQSALAQVRDPILTSDTQEYCGVLISRLSGMSRTAAMPPPVEVVALSKEGERMCVRGQTRGGIMRLRRAFAIMRHGEE